MLQNVKNIVFLVRVVSYCFRGVRTENIGVIMVSISGRQQQLTNMATARFTACCLLYTGSMRIGAVRAAAGSAKADGTERGRGRGDSRARNIDTPFI